ncbi:hypothetical protein B4Q13_20935, partial [Lacticaseibacillus rhamnosus]
MLFYGETFYPDRLPMLRDVPIYTQRRSTGYDAQFYSQIAVAGNPFHPDLAKALDSPAYRSHRILLPLLVHAAGFGLDGSTGQNLFALTASASGAAASLNVDAAVSADPDRIAAASSLATVPGDAGNALLLARIAEQPVQGVLTPGQAYSRLVGQVGARKAEAAQTLSTREAMTAQIEQMRESISGVSL